MSKKTLISLEPDMNIEPGHQWIVLPWSPEGCELAKVLTGAKYLYPFLDMETIMLRIPHNADVDARIVALIDDLAHVRFSAPDLIQLTMEEVAEEVAP